MTIPSPDPAQAGGSVSSTTSLARRLQGLTNNLIATGLILVVGLVVGREMILGWRGGDLRAPDVAPLAELAPPSNLRLPEGVAWSSRPFVGPYEAALAALEQDCLQVCAASDPRAHHLGLLDPALVAEARVLATQGPLTLYAQVDDFPLLVGVITVKDGGGAGQAKIVCWGLALPAHREADDEDAAEPLVDARDDASQLARAGTHAARREAIDDEAPEDLWAQAQEEAIDPFAIGQWNLYVCAAVRPQGEQE
jgi:hypothetical protein